MALVKDLKTLAFEADIIQLLKKYNYIGADNFPYEIQLIIKNESLPVILSNSILGGIEENDFNEGF